MQPPRIFFVRCPSEVKSGAELATLEERVAAARGLMRDPKVAISDIEAQIGARYTYDTLRWLTRRAPGVRFVWIMGADNLIGFHRWRRWRDIADLAPILVVDRPGSTLRALSSPAAVALARFRRPEREALRFARLEPPAILFLHGPRSDLSSTALRRAAARDGLS